MNEMQYYLHLIDTIRGHIIVVDREPQTQDFHLCLNDAPIMSGGEQVVAKKGWTLGPVYTHNGAKNLATVIAQFYNWDILIDGQLVGIPTEYLKHNAASVLGRSTSERKAQAARDNGRKGGRPRKS